MTGMVIFASSILGATYLLYVLYLAYCAVNRAKKDGKLEKTPRLVRAAAYLTVGIGFVLDVLFNITVGTVMFLESPEIRRLTFTARCKKHLNEPGWRGDRARWACDGWLNPFEEGHC